MGRAVAALSARCRCYLVKSRCYSEPICSADSMIDDVHCEIRLDPATYITHLRYAHATSLDTIMPVELKGSCHCGAVKFSVQSSTPVAYQLCLCSICRKVGGVGGSINLGAHSNTLKIEGKENISYVASLSLPFSSSSMRMLIAADVD